MAPTNSLYKVRVSLEILAVAYMLQLCGSTTSRDGYQYRGNIGNTGYGVPTWLSFLWLSLER